MTRRPPALLALVTAAVVAAGVLFAPAGAQGGNGAAAALLDEAERATGQLSFRGTIVVEWSDERGTYREEVPAEAGNGRVRVGDTLRVQDQSGQTYDAGRAWTVVWGSRDQGSMPDPQRKYQLRVVDGGTVAGRPARLVEARTSDGSLRQRTYVDAATSLVLRRDVVDGGRVRTVEFSQLDEDGPVSAALVPPTVGSAVEPRPVASVPDGLVAPATAGDGYRLVGRYREPDGTYHLFYSDGLFTISVFQTGGTLERGSLPAGGSPVRVGGTGATRFDTAMGAVYVWQRDGVVFSALGDAPGSDVGAVSATIVRDDRTTVERVVDWLLGPFRF